MTRTAKIACAILFALILAPALAAAAAAAAPAPCAAPTAAGQVPSPFQGLSSPPRMSLLHDGQAASGDLGLQLFAGRFQASSGCGPDFCTAAQRTACDNQCEQQGHGPFVGLECCTSSCQTLCICGSRPVGC